MTNEQADEKVKQIHAEMCETLYGVEVNRRLARIRRYRIDAVDKLINYYAATHDNGVDRLNEMRRLMKLFDLHSVDELTEE